MMANETLTAVIEQGEDGGWGAHVHLGEALIVGLGDSKEEAMADLRRGVEGWIEDLKERGLPVPDSYRQLVGVEAPA
jgi:predicted RNase H-like HicB family nuclease